MKDGDDDYSTRSWPMVERRSELLKCPVEKPITIATPRCRLAYQAPSRARLPTRFNPLKPTLQSHSPTTPSSPSLCTQVFTETVYDHNHFRALKEVKWYRLGDGMSVGAYTMSHQDTSTNTHRDGSPSIDVTCNIALKDTGSEMIVTTTGGCGKIAINKQLPQGPDEVGSVSSTDLPITNVVYPSCTRRGHARLVDGVVQLGTERGAPVPDYEVVKSGRDEHIVTLQNLVKQRSCERNPPAFDFLYKTHHP
ncbi:hypothetical protein QQZ08_004449 [Neonectria magnoliae]|uniref:Uncharacterized protein n=1 Tax=Neonectria magnoliae TaxID=2732573 RepID=A0ABR1I644_9HYPO